MRIRWSWTGKTQIRVYEKPLSPWKVGGVGSKQYANHFKLLQFMQKTLAFSFRLPRGYHTRGAGRTNLRFFMKVSLVAMMILLLFTQLLTARESYAQKMEDKLITLELR